MKHRLLLMILLLTIAVHEYATAQDTNSNPNDLMPYDCGTVFWSIDESHNIRQWNLEGSTISGGQTILTAPLDGLTLSFGEIDNVPGFYSAGNGVYSIYHPNSGWFSFSTVFSGYGSSGGFQDEQYYLLQNGFYSKLYYYDGAHDLNIIYAVNFLASLGGVAVDLQGHAYIVDDHYNIKIYDHSGLLQTIPIINRPAGFNTICTYGMFFINNKLYYGTRSCGSFNPDMLTPIIINGNTAEIGTPIPFVCEACVDVASCNRNLLAADSFKKSPVVLYPNPGKNTIHINFDGIIEALDVYAVDGRSVNVDSNSDQTQIDISSLKSGVYFIGIQASGKRFTQRFIKV